MPLLIINFSDQVLFTSITTTFFIHYYASNFLIFRWYPALSEMQPLKWTIIKKCPLQTAFALLDYELVILNVLFQSFFYSRIDGDISHFVSCHAFLSHHNWSEKCLCVFGSTLFIIHCFGYLPIDQGVKRFWSWFNCCIHDCHCPR